jgi:putative transposase
MKLRRNFKYRIYPTDEQSTTLYQWEGTLRFLWNLCHEQRLMGLSRSKDERVFINNYDQQKQMTELLEEYPWISEVQCQARQDILADLEKAWSACFKKLAKKPRWKQKGRPMHIYIPNATCPSTFRGDRKTGRISFRSPQYRKLGDLKIVLDRPIQGIVKGWDILRNQNEWYIIARCEIEREDPTPINNEVVGIDRGVNLLIADSKGRVIENPKFFSDLKQRIARAQREVDRKKKGSANQKKARIKVAKLQRLVARRREVFIHTESLYYAKNYGTVVMEKLNIKNMTASASGSIDEPGTNIAQKTGLNRSILDSGWGKFGDFTKYKLNERGGTLKEVSPSYSSQTCPRCKHISKDNRKTQSEFKCVKCDYIGNADVVAAMEIESRGTKNEVVKKKERQKIFSRGRKPKIEEKTAVKPTVVQSVEDKLTVSLDKTNDQSSVETETGIRENASHIYGETLEVLTVLDTEISQ